MRHFIPAIVCSFLSFFSVYPVVAHAQAQQPVQAAAVPESREQIRMSFAPLVKQVAPAVVSVSSKRVVTQRVSPFMGDPFFEQFFGGDFGGLNRQRVESALGSGVIVDPDGLVVTNAHVVKNAEEITVTLSDGRELAAKKALVDEPSDLALLRIDGNGTPLPFAALALGDNLAVGDLVLAIGNPFGVGQTVTSGIVSALSRSNVNINDFNFFIQTDAAINPGNSGGPLVAMDGGVVGINSAIFSRDGGSLGIGFAIPSEMVATVIAAEKAGQKGDHAIARAWLGIGAQKITQDIADSLGLDVPQGVLIAGLHKSSPARKAGLQVGDIVTAVNGKAVRDPAEMKFRMATVPLGGMAAFDLMRKGEKQTVRVQAIAPPDDPPRKQTKISGDNPLSGATVANINPAVAVETGVAEEAGVVVLAVEGRGPAARLVGPGEIIAGINGTPVATVDELQKALAGGSVRGAWQVTLSDKGRQRNIIVR